MAVCSIVFRSLGVKALSTGRGAVRASNLVDGTTRGSPREICHGAVQAACYTTRSSAAQVTNTPSLLSCAWPHSPATSCRHLPQPDAHGGGVSAIVATALGALFEAEQHAEQTEERPFDFQGVSSGEEVARPGSSRPGSSVQAARGITDRLIPESRGSSSGSRHGAARAPIETGFFGQHTLVVRAAQGLGSPLPHLRRGLGLPLRTSAS